jgi:hypothetical protein
MKPALFVDRPSHHEALPDWSDTVPACFRSEAFAEDLSTADPVATSTGPQPQRAGPRRPRPWAALVAALALVGRRRAAAH